MRIISGKHQRRKINPPKNLPVRPTTDFAKEALFNILNNKYSTFENLTVLDLFSGTGSISLEFASRGAKSVMSIDSNSNCINFIKKTAEELDLPIETEVIDAIQYSNSNKIAYDIVFADPPYTIGDDDLILLHQLVTENLLVENGLFILEHSKHALKDIDLPSEIDRRKYGATVFRWINKE